MIIQVHNGHLRPSQWDEKVVFGTPPPPPIHSSPSSAHNGIGQIRPKIWRLHFSTKREIADMSTHFFLNSEDESEAVEDFYTLHWSPFPTTPTYIVGCPTRPGEPACSRAANHPFLSEQAFRSGRREGQELGSVIRVCSLLTALLTHLRKDQKISSHCPTFRNMKCQTHLPPLTYV